MTNPAKWWGEPRDPGEPCRSAEEFRARCGEYTLRMMYDIAQIAEGQTGAEERFRFDRASRAKLEQLCAESMLVLYQGGVELRPGAAEADTGFQQFLAAAMGRPHRGRRRSAP